MYRLTCILCLVAFLLPACGEETSAPSPASTQLTLAIAASMQHAADEVITAFKQAHPHIHIRATYGSSGGFFAQIQSGAPFDLFLSADTDYPRSIVQANLAAAADLFPYATGRLALWVHRDSNIDLDSRGMAALTDPSIRKIAIANPKLAPYGQAAIEALTKHQLHGTLQSKFVLGENIAQTAQYLESGAADIGIIALSLAVSSHMQSKGRHWALPESDHEPLAQAGVILAAGVHRDAAVLFRDYLLSEAGQMILAKHGFTPPHSPGTK